MPLLNPPDIIPEAMRFLLRALLAHKHATCERDELFALVAPVGWSDLLKAVDKNEMAESGEERQGSGQLIAQRSFDALVALGLAILRDGRATASDSARQAWRIADEVTAASFSRQLRSHIWRAEASDPGTPRVHDLIGALSLMYAAKEPLRPFHFDAGHSRRFDGVQAERLGADQSSWPVGNRERWMSARRWAVYLGLGRPIPASRAIPATGLIAEASSALIDESDFAAPGLYPIGRFLSQCARVVPVADTGPFTGWAESTESTVSPGMSLTLRQLEAQGHLELENQSDTAGMIVALGTHADLREHKTHVNWHPRAIAEGAPR